MRTKVVIVLPYFGEAGAETMVSRIASHMDLTQIDLEVICIYGEPLNNRLEKAVLDHGVPIRYIGKGLGFSLKATRKLWQELSRFKPDVVHTHLSAGVYVAPWILFHRAKQLHTIHNMPIYEFNKIKRTVMRFLYKTGKAIPVAISAEIKKLTEEFYSSKFAVELIYNPVDISRFADACHDKNSIFTMVTAGRLSEQKNQKLMIEVVRELLSDGYELVLNILGDGPLREELGILVKEYGIADHVFLRGKVNNVEDYFGSADVFVLSSDYEGLPLVVLEAMAAGLPIISTDVGGVKDIVTDNGILVPSNSLKALIDATRYIYGNKNKREQLSEKSYERVLPYDSNYIASLYQNLYIRYA